jgi:hypothetical protein
VCGTWSDVDVSAFGTPEVAIISGLDRYAVFRDVGLVLPFLERSFIEVRGFSRAIKNRLKRGPLGRVFLDGCCQSEVAGNDRPDQSDEDGVGKYVGSLQKLCMGVRVNVCMCCVCEWKDKEMAIGIPDISYTLFQQAWSSSAETDDDESLRSCRRSKVTPHAKDESICCCWCELGFVLKECANMCGVNCGVDTIPEAALPPSSNPSAS